VSGRHGAVWVLLALAVAAVTASAWAVTIRCEGCHAGGPRLVHDPRRGGVRDVAVPVRDLRRSDHARLSCRDCHVGRFDLFPHPPRARRTLRCHDCHPRRAVGERLPFSRIVREVAASAHGRVAGFACESCHDPHTTGVVPAELEAALVAGRRLCLACHGPGATGPGADPLRPDAAAAHARLPLARLHLARTRCGDCHTAAAADPLSHTLPPDTAAPCRACHGRAGALALRLARWLPPAPPTLAGGEVLALGWITGAILPWPLHLGAAAALAVSMGVAARLRRRWSVAVEPPTWLRAVHVLLAWTTLALLASGVVLHLGLPGFAAAHRLHLAAGLALVGLLLALFAAAAAGGLARWRLAGGLAAVRAELRAAAAGAATGRCGDGVGPLRALVYRVMLFGVMPVLAASGLLLAAAERLAGLRRAGVPADAVTALLHLAAAWAVAGFLVLHLALALRLPEAGRRIRAMLGLGPQPSSRRSRVRQSRARST